MMARKPVIIKKYENRRLYDSTNSRYINQDEVAEMVREGREVQVVDAATGEDLTRLVLTQIIVEDAKAQDSAFPLDILRQMVVASGRATKENTLTYVKTLLDMYQNTARALSPQINPLDFMRARPVPPEVSVGSPSDRQSAHPGHVQQLQQRVEELEALMTKMTAGRTAGRNQGSKPKAKARRKS